MAEDYFQWDTQGGGNEIKGTEEGGGSLKGGGRKSSRRGRKSLRRGAEVLEEGDGNQTELVWRSILYWAANKQ